MAFNQGDIDKQIADLRREISEYLKAPAASVDVPSASQQPSADALRTQYLLKKSASQLKAEEAAFLAKGIAEFSRNGDQ